MSAPSKTPRNPSGATPTIARRLAVDSHHGADHRRIAAEPAQPEAVAEHDDRLQADALAFAGSNSRPATGVRPRPVKKLPLTVWCTNVVVLPAMVMPENCTPSAMIVGEDVGGRAPVVLERRKRELVAQSG